MKTRLLAAVLAMVLAGPAVGQELSPQREVLETPTGALESVCHLTTQRQRLGVFPRTTFNSTAVVYRGRYLITAAHNVYSPWNSRLRELHVACGGREPSDAEHFSVDPSRTRVAQGYGWRRFHRDFAVIALPHPVTVSQAFALAPPDGAARPVLVAGYPGSSPENERMNGHRLFVGESEGAVDPSGPFIRYGVKTYTGNSGGPVWYAGPDGPVLAGVHVSQSKARIADAEFIAEVERMIRSLE